MADDLHILERLKLKELIPIFKGYELTTLNSIRALKQEEINFISPDLETFRKIFSLVKNLKDPQKVLVENPEKDLVFAQILDCVINEEEKNDKESEKENELISCTSQSRKETGEQLKETEKVSRKETEGGLGEECEEQLGEESEEHSRKGTGEQSKKRSKKKSGHSSKKSRNFFIDLPVTKNLKTFLQGSFDGSIILNHYEKNGSLDYGTWQSLCNLILKNLFKNSIRSLRREHFEELTEKIVELFPHESEETFYIPGFTTNINGRTVTVQSKGKLAHKYRNLKTYLNKKQYQGDKSSSDEDLDNEELVDAENNNVEAQNALLWLKHHTNPWPEVLEKWKETASIRLQNREKENIFQSWIHYREPLGHNLVEIDFEHMHSGKSLCLLARFESIFEELKKHSEVTVPRWLEEIDLCLSEDGKNYIRLKALPYLIPPTTRKNKKRTSVAESLETFLLTIQLESDIQHTIQEKRATAFAKKECLQPFVIVVCPQRNEPKKSVVVLNDNEFEFCSVLKAVDFLFKLFYVFNLQYPIDCQQIWFFLQLGVFDINTQHDKLLQCGSVLALVKRIKKNEKH